MYKLVYKHCNLYDGNFISAPQVVYHSSKSKNDCCLCKNYSICKQFSIENVFIKMLLKDLKFLDLVKPVNNLGHSREIQNYGLYRQVVFIWRLLCFI